MLAGAFERVQAPPPKPEMTESCPGLVARNGPRVIPAAFKLAALAGDQVRITYVGHSTFLLESPRVVRVATDYNDYVRPPILPDIVTMNHAHSTHYTDSPDPGIAHVLRGWASEYGKPVRHDLQVKDVRVRNVPTNIRDYGGGTERHGNSIFVFEIANLCIAHLGHLHHTLNQQQMNEIGRIDAVLVPVDGSYTLDLEGMVEVLEGAEGAADDPDALFQRLHARPFPRPDAREIRCRNGRYAVGRDFQDHAAGEAQGAGAAGPLKPDPFSQGFVPPTLLEPAPCLEPGSP